jgi:hypothetical protein
MNNSINLANANAPKTGDPLVSSNTKTAQNGLHNADTDDSGVTAGSFHESIKQAHDESKTSTDTENTDKSETDQSGKDLPVSADSTESTAQDDRPVLPAGLHLSSQSADSDKHSKIDTTQNPSLTAKINADSRSENEPDTSSSPAGTDKKTEADSKLTGIPAQLRQLLATEKDGETKSTKSGLVRNTNSST